MLTPQSITVIPTTRQMALARFRPNGEQLFAAGRDGKIHRWDLRRGDDNPADALVPSSRSDKPVPPVIPELVPLDGHDGWVTQILFHSSRQELYSADSWGRLIGWSLAGESPTSKWNLAAAHDGWIRHIALSPDGERLASVGKDKVCRLWSTSDGKLLQEFAQPDDLHAVAFAPDGKSLLTGDLRGVVQQRDLAASNVVREFDAKEMYLLSWIQDVGGVRGLTFDAAGTTLAVAGAQPTSGGFVQAIPFIKFFDWADGKERQTLKLGDNTQGYVQDLAWHPQGYWLGVTSGQPGQGSFFLHRTGEEKPFFTQALPNCHSVALSADGRRCAVLANAGTSGQKKSMAREGNYPGNTSPIHVFELTPL